MLFRDIWDRHGVLKQSSFSWGGGSGVYWQAKNLSEGTRSPLPWWLTLRFVICTGASVGAKLSLPGAFFPRDVVCKGPVKYWSLFIYSGITETTNTADRYCRVYVWIQKNPGIWVGLSVNYRLFSCTLPGTHISPTNGIFESMMLLSPGGIWIRSPGE